ncbi:DoxX family protein [Oleomonas cavernae]|uniref:DoxX family protein n=1 Tax=Oleomonas cavernae TaxID=2320859 RepID=A0A418VU02_9PROT|nr:DoxX family protein [Oleomonas cavernae]RJF80638.1 DoxX family protein [Oleomonas cavernae]
MNDQVTAASLGALILRLTLGVLSLAHGLVLKVMTFGLAGTAGYFESIGYPGGLAYLVAFAEIAAGLGLILGLLPRLAALASIPLLIGAALQHVGNGWVFSGTGGGWEFPVAWTVLLLACALIGPGAYALGARLPGKLARL